jgi:hypothetical protein
MDVIAQISGSVAASLPARFVMVNIGVSWFESVCSAAPASDWFHAALAAHLRFCGCIRVDAGMSYGGWKKIDGFGRRLPAGSPLFLGVFEPEIREISARS